MVTGDSKITSLSDVIETELENGEAVLLHMGTQSYYSLNQTALHMWHLMKEGRTLNEVSEGVEAEFDISREEALKSVIELATNLVSEKLVGVAEG